MSRYQKLSLLVVDDMSSMRLMIKSVLRHLGVEKVKEASDGEKALEILASQTFDLIICDWDMPRKTGLEVLQAVRADSRTAAVPFIMLTANSARTFVTRAIESGVSDYLAKRFKPQDLIDKIDRVLGDRSA